MSANVWVRCGQFASPHFYVDVYLLFGENPTDNCRKAHGNQRPTAELKKVCIDSGPFLQVEIPC